MFMSEWYYTFTSPESYYADVENPAEALSVKENSEAGVPIDFTLYHGSPALKWFSLARG
jgi:hypothetical protein